MSQGEGRKEGGLDWNRFVIFKRLEHYGEGAIAPVKGNYFILNVFYDPHARVAFKAYAESVAQENPKLSEDMLAAIADMPYTGGQKTKEVKCQHCGSTAGTVAWKCRNCGAYQL